jgi:hypothetical protein
MNRSIRYGLVSLLAAVLALIAALALYDLPARLWWIESIAEWLVVLFVLGGIVLLIVGLIRGGDRTRASTRR